MVILLKDYTVFDKGFAIPSNTGYKSGLAESTHFSQHCVSQLRKKYMPLILFNIHTFWITKL